MSAIASPAPPAPPVRSKAFGLSLGVLLFRLRALIALFVLIGVFSVLTPAFFTEQNLIILVGQTAINAIMAVGMTFVILTGGIDLSVGSTVGFAAMMSGLVDQSRSSDPAAWGGALFQHPDGNCALSLPGSISGSF